MSTPTPTPSETKKADQLTAPSMEGGEPNTSRAERKSDPTTSTPAKRGRRPIFSAEFQEAVRAKHPNIRSRRGLANRCYEEHARQVIKQSGSAAELAWLNSRPTILSELGRIRSEAELLRVARFVCGLKPSAREATLGLRGVRDRKPADPQTVTHALAGHFTRCINGMLARFPKTTTDQIWNALQIALEQVGASATSKPDGC